MLTVAMYSAKYGVPESTVYSGLYCKRLQGQRTEAGWLIEDVPPPLRRSKVGAAVIDDFYDYELALLWLNSTIVDDTIVIRSKDGFVPSYFSEKLDCALWRRDKGTFVCKISSTSLVHSLRGLGFTGRKDHALSAPDVDQSEFSAAFVESRSSFVRQLRYDRRHPMDKTHAYYVPAISMCASYAIMDSAIDALCSLGIIPLRKLSPAANQSSATLRITSAGQLSSILNVLSAYGKNAVFWDAFELHIKQGRQPYYADSAPNKFR